MLEVEVSVEECNHIFVVRIESVLKQPQRGEEIKCQVCNQQRKIRSVGVAGRVREEKPKNENQSDLFKE